MERETGRRDGLGLRLLGVVKFQCKLVLLGHASYAGNEEDPGSSLPRSRLPDLWDAAAILDRAIQRVGSPDAAPRIHIT